jgi:hypothetical protein
VTISREQRQRYSSLGHSFTLLEHPLATHKHSGLRWRKLDLHVHTPASRDYTGPIISPDEFVAKCLAKGLSAIAITDHNSGEWIDRMVAASKGTGLTVFPGVEVSVTGGKSGIHIIALFDCDATTKTIENLLANLKFSATDYGNLEAVSALGPEAVVDEIHAAGGLAILAHADSSKGVLSDMTGQQRIRVMNSRHLSAVEVKSVGRTAPFCSGKDPSYKRRLAYYRASDNRTPITDDGHSIHGVGARYSWFKSDGLSLDALKQVFSDPELRIRCDEESLDIPDQMYPRIQALSVSQGFLKNMTFEFHEGLNSIIGGKGVGKSVLVELLRFALAQPSMIADVQLDMQGKLEHQLGIGGQVTVRVQLEADQIIEITRTYDGLSAPIACVYADSRKNVAADISQLFPVLAYSQTEALAIAKDNHAQLTLIDTLLDLTTIESRIATLETDLRRSDSEIAGALAAEDQLERAEKDLGTHDEKIAGLERALKSRELDALNELKPKSDCLSKVDSYADALEEAVDGLTVAVKGCVLPKLPSALTKDDDLRKLILSLADDAKKLADAAKGLEQAVAVTAKRSREAVAAWDRVVGTKKREYQAFIAKQGGDRASLLAKKSAQEAGRPALVATVDALKRRIAGLPELRSRRAGLLGDLDAEIQKRHELRRQKYLELTTASNGRLELGLTKDGNRLGFIDALSVLKTGSRIQDATIEQLCQHVGPRELRGFVLNGDPEGLAKAGFIQVTSAKTLINHLSASEDVKGFLALDHGELLQDRPAIKFRKDDGKYYDLSLLSVGQKCTALLIIALADGNRPIIIDQPEDALDITSVYEDVTLQLRGRKQSRQFIVTTHNPTVAVAADSDQFHVLTASASQAELATKGAIDRPVVRTAVIQHLEGGAIPFALKTKKYGLPTS